MLTSEILSGWLAWAQPLLAPWWTAWGVPVSYLEALAFVLSLWMVACNLRVNPLGWPLAIASSLLYGILFAQYGLYGEASLQWVFVFMAVWGWWQWLRGVDAQQQALTVRKLSPQGRLVCMGALVILWPVLGGLLDHITDSTVPYWDALPTAGSLIGQWLLGRKWVDNWPCWLAVNVISMGLFAYKELWLTVILYGIFAVLSAVGWRQWLSLAAQGKARA